jgi:hypothetical protein
MAGGFTAERSDAGEAGKGLTLNPWRHVDSDDDVVADFLAGTIEVVVEAGGWIHPGAVVVVRDGAASVACDGVDGEPLLQVPRSCFLRIMRVEWGRQADALDVTAMPDGVTDLERELLILQVAFHNARGALPALVRTHPTAATDLSAGVIDVVRALRPEFRMHPSTPVDLFWTARAFRVPTHQAEVLEPVGVPLIDLLDHHARGATPTLAPDGFAVPVSAPERTSAGLAPCRLDYGRERDALDMAIVYGFADTSADIAHSASAEVTFSVSDPERAVREVSQARGITRAEAQLIAAAVAEESLALLSDVQERAAACTSQAAATLGAAAEHQARVIARAMGI